MGNKKKMLSNKLYFVNGICIVMYIFIYALCITLLYNTHKQEQKCAFYETEIQKYKQELLLSQSNDCIKKYAEQILHMKQLNLKEIKKIIIKKVDT